MEIAWYPLKLLITGASGLLGSKLAKIATAKNHVVYSTYNQHPADFGVPIQLNITDRDQVEMTFKKAEPDIVVHAASLTDVDKCELNKELAWKINVEGAKNVAQASKDLGALLIYISTDYVFDGEKGCYVETDVPSPVNYYGLTKLRAEEQVKDAVNDYCIARPSVIYGSTPAAGKINFALWLINKLKAKEQIKIVVDQCISPTLNTSLATMVLEVAERKLTGIYHLSGATPISRYDFAKKLAQVFDLNTDLLLPVSLAEFSWTAKRPKNSSLNTTKAQQKLANKPLEISQALKQLKKELS